VDINVLRQIAVVLGAVAFLGICWWAFSPKRKQRFEEDAQLPFADEELSARSARHAGKKDGSSTQDEEPSATDKEPSATDKEPSAQGNEPSALGNEPSAQGKKERDEQ
jgi:cytochrome c oxidase cbb3-type subunit 4